MKLRLIAGISGFLLLFAAINFYIGWHGSLYLATVFQAEHLIGYWVVYWLAAFSYLFAYLGRKVLPGIAVRGFKITGAYAMAVMLYGLLLLPVADLAALLLRAASVSASDSIVWSGFAVLLVMAALFVFGSWNAWNPIVRKYEIAVPKQAGNLKGLRVAVASDLHLGAIVGNRHLNRLVRRMNAMAPDLILLPGDVIDDDIEPFIRMDMGSILKRLESRLGIFAVLGNHEYYGGHIDEYVKRMKDAGIDVLMDRTIKVADSFYVIGRKDRTAEGARGGGRMTVDRLLEQVDSSYPIIMMDHQPYQLDKAEAAGIDVLLSGHTHRGQMAPNHWITRRLFELDWGYLRKGRMHAIVSSGFGTWGPPIRIGSRSEIIELDIRFTGDPS